MKKRSFAFLFLRAFLFLNLGFFLVSSLMTLFYGDTSLSGNYIRMIGSIMCAGFLYIGETLENK